MVKYFKLGGKFLVAGAVAIGAITLVTYEEHKASDKYQRDCQSHVSAVPYAPNSDNAYRADECQDPKQYIPWWYVLIAWPDGITVWALLATFGAIVWQAMETRKAAIGAINAAEATQRSIELTIHMQRARMGIRVRQIKDIPNAFDFHAINLGKTNAKLIYARGFFVTLEGGQPLPATPPYLTEVERKKFIISWVSPEDEFPLRMQENQIEHNMVLDLTDEAKRNDIRLRGHTVWAYGRICYEDGISSEMREKRFCYYVTINEHGNAVLVAGGPDSYWMDT
jgi:hypothetical protein